jgi:Tfp pilus assembly protein PilW
MKLPFHSQSRRAVFGRSIRLNSGHTLVELMISMVLLILVVGGVVYAQLAGMKMRQMTELKLGASDQARLAIQRLIAEVRTAKRVEVGSGGASSFTPAASQSLQQGPVLEIYSTTNFNHSIRYFLDTSTASLNRLDSQSGTGPVVVAESLNNNVIFTSEDFRGTVLTDKQNNRVIGVVLQFFQIKYPVTQINSESHYDFYQLRTKITRRALE